MARVIRIFFVLSMVVGSQSDGANLVLFGTGTVRDTSTGLDVIGAVPGDIALIRVEYDPDNTNVADNRGRIYTYHSPTTPYDPPYHANVSFTLAGQGFSLTGGAIQLYDGGNQFMSLGEAGESFTPLFHEIPGVVLTMRVEWLYQFWGRTGDRIFETLDLPQTPEDLNLSQIAGAALRVTLQPVGPNPIARRGYTINFDIDPSTITVIPEPGLSVLVALSAFLTLLMRRR